MVSWGDTFALQVSLALRFTSQKQLMPILCSPYTFWWVFGCRWELPNTFALIVSSFYVVEEIVVRYQLAIIHSLYLFFFWKVALSGTPLSCQMFVKEEVEKPIGSLIRNHYHLRYHTETELSVQPFVWTNAMMMCLPFSFKTFDQKSKVSHSECHVCVLTSFSASKLQCL